MAAFQVCGMYDVLEIQYKCIAWVLVDLSEIATEL